MSWAWVVALLAFALGLGILFALGWRLFRQVRSLGRTVGDASERVAVAQQAPGDKA